MLERYVRHTETPAERAAVQKYVSDDAARFEMLLQAMRLHAMEEMNIDPESDFLPGRLHTCVGAALADSEVFAVAAGARSAMLKDNGGAIFSLLQSRIIDGLDAQD